MTLVRFTHDRSILLNDGFFTLYGPGDKRERFMLEVTSRSEAVQLDEGLVHIATPSWVYQVQEHPTMGFQVQRIDRL